MKLTAAVSCKIAVIIQLSEARKKKESDEADAIYRILSGSENSHLHSATAAYSRISADSSRDLVFDLA